MIFFPAVTADVQDTCPGCGMVWKDTCAPFERNNETAYNEEILASFALVAANQTPLMDLHNRSWSDAFRSAHNLMKEQYVYTQWRGVDWDALYTAWAPAIADAEKNGDKAAYYRALRGYISSIPDGHIGIMPTTGEFGAKYADIGGSYGFSVTRLDSGRVMVSYVGSGSPAEKSGIRFGDEISGFNGKNIGDAINSTSYIWAVKKPSTAEAIQLQQLRFMTRAPVGTNTTVMDILKGESVPRAVDLVATDDGYDTLIQTTTFLGRKINDVGVNQSWTDIQPQISNDTVTTRILPGGYTYLAVYGESYEMYRPFKAAMLSAIANKSPGIVIDLRWNSGGDDNIASCMAGWFVDTPAFYEYATEYDPGLHRFSIVSEARTAPRPESYRGPVAVLVSPDTISSGEGVPMVFTNAGRGKIIGYYGTNGAFGMNNIHAVMPFDQYLFFPAGASLNQDKKIQVDSNASRLGGIAPQIRVPINEDTVARSVAGEDVQLTYALNYLDSEQVMATTSGPADTIPPTRKSPSGVFVAFLALGLLFVIAKRR